MWSMLKVRSGYRGEAFLTHNTKIGTQTSFDFQSYFA